jgi:hypothetical protein
MKHAVLPPSGPIQEKIAWAEDGYRDFKGKLLADHNVVQCLDQLQKAVQESHAVMEEIGLNDLCRTCDEWEGGSCCGAGLENRYDGWVLLINLLLGRQLPTTRQDERSCFFLGKDGCTLLARHVICINYVCQKITDSIPKALIQQLREKEGDEIECLFLLNERIKSILFSYIGGRCQHAADPRQFSLP